MNKNSKINIIFRMIIQNYTINCTINEIHKEKRENNKKKDKNRF